MKPVSASVCTCFLLLLWVAGGIALGQEKPASLGEAMRGKALIPGLFPLYWDENSGKLWMVVNRWEKEFLYINSLPAGVGSSDIGLDRGQLGDDRIVFFRKVGPKVLLMQPNLQFRADSADPAEKAAVEQSFAQAVVWGFKAEFTFGDSAVIDITDFALRDAHRVIQRLRSLNEGEFKVDASRSAIYLERTKNFPQNTEIEAMLTYVSERAAGRDLQTVAPSSFEFTVRQHHSFVELPEPGYQPRAFDPRSGFGAVTYMDYAAPIGEDIEKRLLPRHRLRKKDPSATLSEPVRPIVYYVDRGAPEPIRTALLEGARWWNQAFEAAGYRGAFRVEVMPEGADPMDIRYNVIQWVHRSTRGWSYGSSVRDPRTGEILKGHVTLGSLRVRQDYLIATGLLAPYEEGKPVSPKMLEMALARLRQLSAHEVGHTLGLAHNFAASVNGRASVMDYPHPYVALGEDGSIDLSQAYSEGIGEWDKITIAYGYQDFPLGTREDVALEGILLEAQRKGLRYITDRDSRPEGGASPDGHLWDNGADPAAELLRIGEVRRTALTRFSEDVIRHRTPNAAMGEVLVPIYLLHRYQVEAAAKLVGGLEYGYRVRGSAFGGNGSAVAARPIARERQQAALAALLTTLTPGYLRIEDRILQAIPPHPPGFSRTRESFPSRTGLTIDPLAAAEVAADHTVSFLLHPERAARLVEYSARDAGQLRLDELIDQLLAGTVRSARLGGLDGEIQWVTNGVVLYRLMVLAKAPAASDQVKAIASLKLGEVKEFLDRVVAGNVQEEAYARWFSERIKRFLADPKEIPLPKPPEAPPGQPIGCGGDELRVQ